MILRLICELIFVREIKRAGLGFEREIEKVFFMKVLMLVPEEFILLLKEK